MYADYFLKFASQAEADAILFTTHPEVVDDEGKVTAESYQTPNFQNIDVIGPFEDDAAYHVNVRLVLGAESPEAFAGYEVFPAAPRRVWAGPMYPVMPVTPEP